MNNYTEWKAYCLGSEGYQVRKDNEGVPAAKIKEDLKERLTPIVERMGGSFETQRVNAHKIAAVPELLEAVEIALWQEYNGEAEAQKQGKPRHIERIESYKRALDKAEGR